MLTNLQAIRELKAELLSTITNSVNAKPSRSIFVNKFTSELYPSLTNSAMEIVGETTSIGQKFFRVTENGYIQSIATRISAGSSMVAGNYTLTVFKNGSVVTNCLINHATADAVADKYLKFTQGLYTFATGDKISLRLTSSADLDLGAGALRFYADLEVAYA